MRNRLKNLFKKRHDISQRQTKLESHQYDKNYQQWQRTIEKDEKLISSQDATTYRETFEKTFPELRKTREDKEKKQASLTDSSSSEQPLPLNAEQELELEEEKLRKSSIVPPIIYNSWQRRHQYFNRNGFIRRDAAEFYKERTKMPFWTAEEKQIFIEKFTQSPKNFGYISSFLENKTTEQCVQFYYMTKKTENYKNLLRKQSQATRRRAKQNATTTTTTVTSSTTIETTLVTKVTSSNTIVSSTSQQLLGQSNLSVGDQVRSLEKHVFRLILLRLSRTRNDPPIEQKSKYFGLLCSAVLSTISLNAHSACALPLSFWITNLSHARFCFCFSSNDERRDASELLHHRTARISLISAFRSR